MFTKHLYWLIPVSVILTPAYLLAEPPRKPNIGMFQSLINASPFTIKPEKEKIVQDSPLERDWTLASISPSGDGFSVTLMNKKDRTNRLRFMPGFEAGEYKLLNVNQDASSRKDSKVQIQKGSQTAWIGYDDNILKTQTKTKRPSPKTTGSKVTLPPGVKSSTTNIKTPTRNTIPTRRVRRVPIKK